jgi:peptidoglycan/LPS O-acetylase OafA/YrhL
VKAEPITSQPFVADVQRVAGLNALRFICALWVVFSHFGFVPLADFLPENKPGMKLILGLYHNLFCGIAAVIVFFLISGFCIHFPFRNAASIPFYAFITRRYIRIGIPLIAALSIVFLCKSAAIAGFYEAILWSLVAESIYYTIYPVLFPLLRDSGWNLIIGAYLFSFCVILWRPQAKSFHDFGPFLTWIVGLPCWLLGCMLANQFPFEKQLPNHGSVLFWRCAIWALATFSSILRFHGSIGYPWTLSFFAIGCFFWLRAELRWFQIHPPNRNLERAGLWSYSLYLCHVPVFMLLPTLPVFNIYGPRTAWILQIASCLLISYTFFRLVENPSHSLARYVGRLLPRLK